MKQLLILSNENLNTLLRIARRNRAPKNRVSFTLLALIFLLVVANVQSFSQSIGMTGAPCTNNSIVFYLQGNCSSTSWSLSGGSITSGQNTSSIHATFPSAGNYTVTAHSTCSGVTKYYYYYPTISNTVTPTTSLSVSPSTSCQGSNITFTASGTNGGTPNYAFYVDGVLKQSNSSSTYSTTTLAAGSHSAYVVMTSSLACVTSTSATSTTQNFTVNAPVSYTVSVSGPPLICSSSPSATFNATPSTPYGTLTYTWYLNGAQSGTNSSTFTTNVSQGNTVYCVVSSNYGCINQPVTSNTYTVNITNSVTPTVGVQVSPLTYCAGASISLSATGNNISGTPNYQWLVNGSQFQSSTSSSATLGSSYTNTPGAYNVTVNVTGISGNCLSSNSASNSSPTLTVNPMLTPTASLSLSTTNSCQGGLITFTASSTNGGSPTYNFFIDGVSVQNNSSNSYTTSSLSAGSHSAYVVMTSSITTCMTSTSATSTTQNFTITAPVSYTVSVSGPATVCSSSPSGRFNANPSNSYGTLTYQWYQGGNTVGTNSSIFDATNLLQGQSVYCRVSSDFWCITSNQVQSNTYTVNITNSVTPVAAVQVSPLSYCSGSVINFSATGTNLTGTPTYSWLLNGNQLGSPSTSSTAPPVTANYINTVGYYSPGSSVTVNISGLSGTCLTSTTATASAPSLTISTPTIAGTLGSITSSFCNNGSISLSVSGNTGSITRYMVQSQDNGGSWTPWTNTTATPTVTTSSGINRTYNFQVFIQSGVCSEVGTNIVSTTVYFGNSIGTLSSSQSLICGASGTTTLSLSSFTTQNAAWKARYSDDGGITWNFSDWNNPLLTPFSTSLSLSQNFTLTATSALRIYQFQVSGTNGSCAAVVSNIVTVNISPVPIASSVGQTLFVGSPTSVALNSTVTGTTFSYSVYSTTNVSNASSGSGSSISNQYLTVTDGVNPGSVTYSVTPSASGCTGNPLNTVVVNVYPQPVINSTSSRVYLGSTATLSSQTFYDQYYWQTSTGQVLGNPLPPTNKPFTYLLYVVKNGVTSSTVSYTLRSEFSGQNLNYIVTNSLMTDIGLDTAQVKFQNVYGNNQIVQYFDGLGRPIQNVATQASPLQNDVVKPAYYDNFGRMSREYLPFSAQNNGLYKSGVIDVNGNFSGSALNFYSNGLTDKIADDPRPFSETIFELSPLNRRLSDFGTGQNWKDNNKSIVYSYQVNHNGTTAGKERVIAWVVDPSSGLPVRSVVSNSSISGGYYTSGQLAIKSIKDEQGHEVREYMDKLGRTILKKVQLVDTNPILKDSTNWTQTYYIYDNLNLLRYVLQPELTKYILIKGGTYNPTPGDLAGMAFQYKYDGRNRMVVKKIPDADSVYMIYDLRDRLVMTQDGNQRFNNGTQWLVTKYDTLDRAIVSALYTHSSFIGRVPMSLLINKNKFCETYNGTAATNGYSVNTVFPILTSQNSTILTSTYYDSYSFISDLSIGASYSPVQNDLTSQVTLNQAPALGHATGGRSYVLASSAYLNSVSYYDSKFHVIQSIVTNNKGGWDRSTSILDFPGRVLNSKTTHHTSTHTDQTVSRRIVYDHGGRVKQVFHTVNTQPEVLLLQNAFNEIGQLVVKSLYSINGGASFTQNVDQRYNIRGWLTSINNSQVTNDGGITNSDINDFFGMNLSYNDQVSGLNNTPQFNGNISAARWSSNMALGSVKDVAYSYSYDALDRISAANYLTDAAGVWSNSINSFSESGYTYDQNGNIKRLKRWGANGSVLDSLHFTYGTLSNQVLSVKDNGGDVTKGFVDGVNSGNDYSYDSNGNMISDQNKKLIASNAVQYNYMNLPALVTKSTSEKLSYIYSADGVKLTQIVYNSSNSVIKTTEYDGEFIYQNDTLIFIQHPEGRIVMKNSPTPEYQYYLRDHLGNVRVTFTTQSATQTFIAGFEVSNQTTEASNFLNYQASKINTLTPSNPNATTGNSAYFLNGGFSGQVGIAKSFSVMPGDVVSIQARAKYNSPSATATNFTPFIASLLSAFSLPTPAPGEVGTPASGINAFGNWELSAAGDENKPDVIKAFVTIILFDRNYNMIDVAYQAVQPDGSLSRTYTIQQPGYAYLYISNEHPYLVDVYFDNVQVTYTPSLIVQQEDFYPFGLTFNSYTRQGLVPQKYLFNGGSEQIDDLGLGWQQTYFRLFDPSICRFLAIDPLAEMFSCQSPMVYANNNPISFNDPFGLQPEGDETTMLREVVVTAKRIKTPAPSLLVNLDLTPKVGIYPYVAGNQHRIQQQFDSQANKLIEALEQWKNKPKRESTAKTASDYVEPTGVVVDWGILAFESEGRLMKMQSGQKLIFYDKRIIAILKSTGAARSAITVGAIVKGVGTGVGIAGLVLTWVQVGTGEKHWIQGGMDTAVGVVGMAFPGPGTVVATFYFLATQDYGKFEVTRNPMIVPADNTYVAPTYPVNR